MLQHPCTQFRKALTLEKPLQIPGVINAYCALLAQKKRFNAIYLSGAGIANACYGLPDLALTSMQDVLVEAQRIIEVCDLPLLVDIDTGFGSILNLQRTIKTFCNAGVAAVHLEDQTNAKRCGHRSGKRIVTIDIMKERIQAAVEAKPNPDFVIMARTDARANESLDVTIQRIKAYVDAGADMIFAEAFTTLNDYKVLTHAISVPILANITEFGKTPLFTLEELQQAGIAMALYPLSAFRAMNFAANELYSTLKNQGSQKDLIHSMETRDQLYQNLHYQQYESKLDNYFIALEKHGKNHI